MTDTDFLVRTMIGNASLDTVAWALLDRIGAPEEVKTMTAAYVTALNLADARESQRTDTYARPPARAHTFYLDPATRRGQRFLRLVKEYVGQSSSRSVHAFVEVATGHVFKAAGWKAPAPDTRYNLLSEASVAALRRALDTPGYFTGGYLYADRLDAYTG